MNSHFEDEESRMKAPSESTEYSELKEEKSTYFYDRPNESEKLAESK